jgi:hypothetical protein
MLRSGPKISWAFLNTNSLLEKIGKISVIFEKIKMIFERMDQD